MEDLKQYYEFVYVCKCGKEYGSDKEEKEKHICPICEGKFREILVSYKK